MRTLLILLSLLLAGCHAGHPAPAAAPVQTTATDWLPAEGLPINGYSVLLVRHAEKLDSGDDPGLSEPGKERARFFARWQETSPLEAIWSSDYRRTRETALPLANAKALEIRLYDPRDLAGLVRELRSEKAHAVVVGHSNTTPGLAALLCQCEVAPMAESEYDRAYLLVMVDELIAISTIDLAKQRANLKANSAN